MFGFASALTVFKVLDQPLAIRQMGRDLGEPDRVRLEHHNTLENRAVGVNIGDPGMLVGNSVVLVYRSRSD